METAVIVGLGCLFVFILMWGLLLRLRKFREEMDYINMELTRTIDSRKYWLKKKRRLWLWLLLWIPYE